MEPPEPSQRGNSSLAALPSEKAWPLSWCPSSGQPAGPWGPGCLQNLLAAVFPHLVSSFPLFLSLSHAYAVLLWCFFFFPNIIIWLLDVSMRALLPPLSVWPLTANPLNPGTPLFPPALIQYPDSLPLLPTVHLLQRDTEGRGDKGPAVLSLPPTFPLPLPFAPLGEMGKSRMGRHSNRR